jgi:hypothetical protein
MNTLTMLFMSYSGLLREVLKIEFILLLQIIHIYNNMYDNNYSNIYNITITRNLWI